MNRENALAKNTIILTIGKFLPQLFNLVTLPIITGKLTTAEYGTYDLILTLVALLLPIATLQIQSAAFRFLIDARKEEDRKTEIITNIVAFTTVISLAALLILFFALYKLDWLTRTLISLYFFFDILNQTLGQIVRGLSHNKEFAISSILLALINMLVIVATLDIVNWGLNGVLIAAIISSAVSNIYLTSRINIKHYLKMNELSKKCLLQMLKYSWPMVPNNLSSWVLKISDRLVITFFLGVEANAIYAVANKIPNILNIARGTFVMAWQENAALVSKDEDATAYYSKMFDVIYSMIIGMTGLLIAGTPIMFKILIRGNYDAAYYQMPLLFIGVFFGCMSAFQGGIYVAYMKTASVGITTMLAAACNLLVDFLLVNRIGITAGSISTLISYFLLFIYRMFDVRKIQDIKYNYMKLIGQSLVIIVMCVLCYIRNIYLDIINLVIGVLFCVLTNKEMIEQIVSKYMKKVKK